jgi:hypothetical protein
MFFYALLLEYPDIQDFPCFIPTMAKAFSASDFMFC